MARVGRPKKDVTKNVMISIRLTDEETKMLDFITSRTGKTISQVIRDSLSLVRFYEKLRENKD